jgi:uncharacterized protein
VGAYQLADGRIIDIGVSDGGLRWRNLDGLTGKLTRSPTGWIGTWGWTGRADKLSVVFGSCEAGTITFDGREGRKLPLEITETEFVSKGTVLKGRLVMPADGQPTSVVVLLQGAERDSARDHDPLQRLLPAQGLGAFVYDKRGTGASGGVYTQDFSLLADDAVAARETASRLAGDRLGRIGFQGPSQGGWVAPIAAGRTPVDFVIVSFGLAVSVFDEDQEAIAFQMGLKGHGPEEIRRAQDIGAAAAELFANGFSEGFERFEEVRARHRDAPWFKDVHGNFTHVLLGMTAEELRAAGKQYRWGTPVRYDPMPTLETLATPQLWVLGGQDIDAPSGETSRRLRRLIEAGNPVTMAIYPTAEHGMTEFITGTQGERLSTRYAAGYFRLMADFARDGRLRPPYGEAVLAGHAGVSSPNAANCSEDAGRRRGRPASGKDGADPARTAASIC